MTTRGSRCLSSISLRASMAVGVGTSLLMATPASAALTSAEINDFRNTIGNRVEAATILGGDYGIGGGSYFSSRGNDHVNINVTKFGGSGDVGAPQLLGNLGIGWQLRLQGSMGYLTAKNNFQSGLLDGDTSEYKTFAIQFGGGARFWFDDHFSIAPTVIHETPGIRLLRLLQKWPDQAPAA